MKSCKEQPMNDKLTTRFEEELKNIKSSLSKNGSFGTSESPSV